MAKMLIKHEANPSALLTSSPSALFCIKHEQGNALTILKNFQTNTLIEACSLVRLDS